MASAYDTKGGPHFPAILQLVAMFIHYFRDLTAPLTDSMRKSKPHKVTLTLACLKAFDTLKLRLISTLCLILPEVTSDATFIVPTYALTIGNAKVVAMSRWRNSPNVFLGA
jgi:hypothetical protein